MTENDTRKVVMTIQAAFPNWKPQAPEEFIVNLWHKFLVSFDKKEVGRAVQAYIATDTTGFAPSIGQIIDKIHVIIEPEQVNDMQAWNLVAKAIQNSSYNAKAEFERLPLVVQKAVGCEQQLKAWASDENFNSSVVSSNFIKTYRQVANRERELAKMPVEIKQLIESNTRAIEEHLIESNAINQTETKSVLEQPTEDKKEHCGMPPEVRKQFEELKAQLHR